MLVNEIYIKKMNKVILTLGASNTPVYVVATIAKNLENLGYTLSPKLFAALQTFSIDELSQFYKDTLLILKPIVGAHRLYEPMYPNFPKQVMEASEGELYFNALMHYIGHTISDLQSDETSFRILPQYEKEVRLPLMEFPKLKVIDLGNLKEFRQIFTNIVGSNSSISESDKEIVKAFVLYLGDRVSTLIPQSIPQKEQLALLTSELLANTTVASVLTSKIKTATDVLRIITAMSGGDVSLATAVKFKSLKRSERRFFLNVLENIPYTSLVEDMLRWKTRWIKLGETLHPSEYASQYPLTHKAFSILRNNEKFETFNGMVEAGIKQKSFDSLAKLLKSRPGDFARRLDHLFRISAENVRWKTAFDFIEVADKVSTPVLLQVYGHFKNRGKHSTRAFFPKGNVAKMHVDTRTLPEIGQFFSESFANSVRQVLVDRFKKLPKLSKVFVDAKLKNYPVPFSQRSASKTLKTISRGSKIDMPSENIIRFFLWWKDGRSRTDIDLSAVMYDDGWKNMQTISYYNLKNAKRKAVHSGDVTSAPNGACEFIDIDVESMVKDSGRYVVMSLNSYTQQPYCDLPECFAGWMSRSSLGSGEIFEPKTVENKIDLTADTTMCIPVVFDLFERKVVWTDLALKNVNWYNNVGGKNGTNVQMMAEAIINLDKPNLFDLLSMHAEARGQIASNKEEAITVFSEHEGTTPYDIDTILSQYLL